MKKKLFLWFFRKELQDNNKFHQRDLDDLKKKLELEHQVELNKLRAERCNEQASRQKEIRQAEIRIMDDYCQRMYDLKAAHIESIDALTQRAEIVAEKAVEAMELAKVVCSDPELKKWAGETVFEAKELALKLSIAAFKSK